MNRKQKTENEEDNGEAEEEEEGEGEGITDNEKAEVGIKSQKSGNSGETKYKNDGE